MSSRALLFTAAIVTLLGVPRVHADTVRILFDNRLPQAAFAAQELQAALKAKGHEGKPSGLDAADLKAPCIVLTLRDAAGLAKAAGVAPSAALKPEGFSIRVTGQGKARACWVIGADAAGLMYGGLELAEVIAAGGLAAAEDADQNPYMPLRGTKFNIPLDVRTPSYTDPCDAAQHNIAEMWSFDFWRGYIDSLARHRYNYISLWSLHPFPSMVRVPDYPDVALDDVQRSTVKWKEYYNGTGRGFDSPEIVGNVETLKRITMDEKIAFWRKVMRHGKSRNVDFYIVTWNIFVNGTQGKHGITDSIRNATTVDYFRKSVKAVFVTYPDLAGIGLTTGENMGRAGVRQKEAWAFATYGQGVLDAAKAMPGRKLTLIHRQHQTGAEDVARTFAPLIAHKDIEFVLSFKYAKAHVYSSTRQTYHPQFARDIGNAGLRTVWTLRNDDVYYFRWGAPDFVRAFIRNIPHGVSRGFYLGSDQYIWGREFLSLEPETPRQIEVDKHWYHWLLWGRLGYDPSLSNARLTAILQRRFPEVPAEKLFAAWQAASLIYPITTGFHWGALDFQWYIEACKSRPGPAKTPSGFHDVERFISLPPHPGTDNVSIPDYVAAVAAGRKPSGTTPIEVADALHGHADKALELLDGLAHGGDKELRLTLADIRTMALLGKYFAHKVRGATELALFRKVKKPEHQQAAIRELTTAAQCWRRYAATALSQYRNPLWTNRVGHCDWRALFRHVLDDITTAGGQPRIPSLPPTAGGTVLQREEGGREWVYEAPEAGPALLEVRYALAEDRFASPLHVNGKEAGQIILWATGGDDALAWDRVPVELAKGRNAIRLHTDAPARIDSLKIHPSRR